MKYWLHLTNVHPSGKEEWPSMIKYYNVFRLALQVMLAVPIACPLIDKV